MQKKTLVTNSIVKLAYSEVFDGRRALVTSSVIKNLHIGFSMSIGDLHPNTEAKHSETSRLK